MPKSYNKVINKNKKTCSKPRCSNAPHGHKQDARILHYHWVHWSTKNYTVKLTDFSSNDCLINQRGEKREPESLTQRVRRGNLKAELELRHTAAAVVAPPNSMLATNSCFSARNHSHAALSQHHREAMDSQRHSHYRKPTFERNPSNPFVIPS